MKHKILDYLATLYADSWLFMKLSYPVMDFKDNVYKIYKECYNNRINNEFDARIYRLINKKLYKIIPYTYKYKIITNIINENIDRTIK